MNLPLPKIGQTYFEVFDNFIKNRIEKYGLIDGEDYIVFNKIIENPSGGRPQIEYALIILSKREARLYLINNIIKREGGSPQNWGGVCFLTKLL